MWSPTSPTEPDAPQRERSFSTRQKNPGKRVAQIVRLKPEHIEEYKACHAKVWPEVLKQIKDCNIEDCVCARDPTQGGLSMDMADSPADSIFHDDKTGILFASFKYVGYDWTGDMEKMAANPKVREWWRMTDGFQESLVDGAVSSEAGEPSWWRPVEEVFYQP